jgi:quinol monooxygenase YgiN
MYQVIHHHTKEDGSEIYGSIMEIIDKSESLRENKGKKPGFIAMRGIVSEDGLTFSVTQTWESEDAFNAHKNEALSNFRKELNEFLKSIGVNVAVEFKNV